MSLSQYVSPSNTSQQYYCVMLGKTQDKCRDFALLSQIIKQLCSATSKGPVYLALFICIRVLNSNLCEICVQTSAFWSLLCVPTSKFALITCKQGPICIQLYACEISQQFCGQQSRFFLSHTSLKSDLPIQSKLRLWNDTTRLFKYAQRD